MSIVLEGARAILATIQPVTGERATGSVLATATGADVVVPRNSHLIPVVDGQLKPEWQFKTDAGPLAAPNKNSWTVTSGGTSVDVLSVIGGVRHNLAAGTVLRWDPPISGLAPTVTVEAPGLAGGADPTFFGGLKAAVMHDAFGAPAASLEAFRSKIGALPGLILIWQSSEPADGSTVSALGRGGGRMGQNNMLMVERYLAVILTNRVDDAHFRRSEGLEALDEVTLWLTDRNMVDGMCVSSPGGVQITNRTRLQGPRTIYQELDVYALSLAITRTYTRHDARTYNDWLLTRMRVQRDDDVLGPKEVVDVSIDMS